jgi:hypothetical protein
VSEVTWIADERGIAVSLNGEAGRSLFSAAELAACVDKCHVLPLYAIMR